MIGGLHLKLGPRRSGLLGYSDDLREVFFSFLSPLPLTVEGATLALHVPVVGVAHQSGLSGTLHEASVGPLMAHEAVLLYDRLAAARRGVRGLDVLYRSLRSEPGVLHVEVTADEYQTPRLRVVSLELRGGAWGRASLCLAYSRGSDPLELGQGAAEFLARTHGWVAQGADLLGQLHAHMAHGPGVYRWSPTPFLRVQWTEDRGVRVAVPDACGAVAPDGFQLGRWG